MDADWITSPSARRVLQHAGDTRPAWLWSQDGQLLLWQNDAAPLFLAKLKKSGLKLAQPALPIKGQIARNIRLGSPGRTSLARIQFLAGDKPTSSTCATTPLVWQDGQMVLLIVGVDPIDADILAAAQGETADESLPETEDPVVETPAEPIEDAQAEPEAPEVLQEADQAEGPDMLAAQEALDEPEVPAPTEEASAEPGPADDSSYEQDLKNWHAAGPDGTATLEVVPEAEAPSPAVAEGEADAPEDETPRSSRLGQLFDRLAAHEELFTPLTEADDAPPALPSEQALPEEDEADLAELAALDGVVEPVEAIEAGPESPNQTEAPVETESSAEAEIVAEPLVEEVEQSTAPEAPSVPADMPVEAVASDEPQPVADPESVERASRYNFDELARILTDRVGEPAQPSASMVATPARGGSLINLGGEALVLNRLPLGILVFRDQQVLFANRAITEMVGYNQ